MARREGCAADTQERRVMRTIHKGGESVIKHSLKYALTVSFMRAIEHLPLSMSAHVATDSAQDVG